LLLLEQFDCLPLRQMIQCRVVNGRNGLLFRSPEEFWVNVEALLSRRLLRMQYLLGRACWDADAVQVRLSEYVKAPGISRSRYFTVRIPRNAPEKFLQTRAILNDSS
jgi:hypothetical protein